jgi:hypothetical protein
VEGLLLSGGLWVAGELRGSKAKRGLAARFGVSPSAIEITIKG